MYPSHRITNSTTTQHNCTAGLHTCGGSNVQTVRLPALASGPIKACGLEGRFPPGTCRALDAVGFVKKTGRPMISFEPNWGWTLETFSNRSDKSDNKTDDGTHASGGYAGRGAPISWRIRRQFGGYFVYLDTDERCPFVGGNSRCRLPANPRSVGNGSRLLQNLDSSLGGV